jgi:hypothetical protein
METPLNEPVIVAYCVRSTYMNRAKMAFMTQNASARSESKRRVSGPAEVYRRFSSMQSRQEVGF